MAFSTCPDLKDLRPQFTGVGVLPYERGIKITGTRHNMLTKQIIECNGDINDCLVPLRFANIISGLQFKGMCKVYRDEQRLGINILGTKITTQFKTQETMVNLAEHKKKALMYQRLWTVTTLILTRFSSQRRIKKRIRI